MPSIIAEQLVFTRLQPAYSPTRRAGYQIAYHSPGLANDAREIENRVKCFGVGRRDPHSERLQYFRLRDGRIVLTYSCPVSHAEIVDKRSGAFLAHCLVLSPQEFSKLRNNPFAIFDGSDPFVHDAEQLVERFIEPQEIDPFLRIDCDTTNPPHTDWPASSLIELRRLGLMAQSMNRNSESVLLIGDSDEAADVLRVLFSLLDNESLRIHCTFSTHVETCRVEPGEYWAVGARNRERPGFLEVDTSRQQIADKPEGIPDRNDSHYMIWLHESLNSTPPDEVVRRASTIQYLERSLVHGETIPDDVKLIPAACADFHRLFPECSLSIIDNCLSKQLSQRTARLLADFIDEQTADEELPLRATGTVSPFNRSEIAKWILRWLKVFSDDAECLRLKSRDWNSIRSFAYDNEYWQLMLWATILDTTRWFKGSLDRVRLNSLQQMDERAFQASLALLQRPVAAHQFVIRRHSATLLDALDWSLMNSDSFQLLVEALAMEGAIEAFDDDRLCLFVARLTRKESLRLHKKLSRLQLEQTSLSKALQAGPQNARSNGSVFPPAASLVLKNSPPQVDP
ncbi:hypothetical protein [Stieleria varia]|uniref:Uncharacterized protein n=1 Tax=Stieleria varia TaxID=2528005 RepID=A0A5C6AY90_9BACT|nr:hypothetical protein [Stieleria varia]TWU04381.1 hypothetical protein Pla52n_24210 [Stieleria varia]